MQKPITIPEDFPKQDVDYYVFADGEYWPVTSLQMKYNCSSFHIYDRAKKNNIPKKKIMDVTLFKDMPDIFKKKPNGKQDANGNKSAEHIKQYRTAQYAELCDLIRKQSNQIEQLHTAINAILNHLTLPKGGI